MKRKFFYFSLCSVLILYFAFFEANFAIADSEPSFENVIFFGGSGNQRGVALRINGSDLYVAGHNSIGQGILVKYNLLPGAPIWYDIRPYSLYYEGLAVPGLRNDHPRHDGR